MTKPRFFLNLGLLAILLASCAPAAVTPQPSPQPASATVGPSATPILDTATEVVVAVPTETLAPTPFPVATSRGPNLEATDPRTVSLASGGLQFVEFFRFT
ncbi:MAG: hypothetical protein IPP66_20840 [Anaerolineales bacterium]|nr:hypothetical protein [Anaerolineales bacterium]